MKFLFFGLFISFGSVAQNSWKELGQFQPKDAKEIESSTWSIGAETMDRDYTDYQSFKSYLGPLGAKRIRLQGGWAKCEKQKAEGRPSAYDFAWLDAVIPDAAERGVSPWVELSYGNPIYEGGGQAKLAGKIPTGEEALTAWDNWVVAMVQRYRDYVPEWEIWNEPDLNKEHTGAMIGEFYLRTAKLVKKHQPNAKLIALGLAGIGRREFVNDFMEYLKEHDGLQYVDVLTYHGYAPNPSTSYPQIEELRKLVWQYKPDIVFMQGENGAPSTPSAETIGALRQWDWSELTQAKWDLRRMLGDHGRGIATNLFTISDIHYTAGDHMVGVNTKGILKTNPDKTIDRPKMAYKAAQNTFTLFDSKTELQKEQTATSDQEKQSVFLYKNKGRSLITIWQNEDRPADEYKPVLTTITLRDTSIKKPVLLDMVTGVVYKIPKNNCVKKTGKTMFVEIPVPDYPIVITDISVLDLK